MKIVYSTLAALHLAGFSVWVVSHSPSPLRGNPLGRLIGWRPVLSVVGYLQGICRVVVPFTSLLHPGREVAVGPQLLIRWEIPTPLAASLYIVIVISEFVKRYSKAKRTRAPAYSRVLRRIKGGFPKGGQEKLRSDFQRTRKGAE